MPETPSPASDSSVTTSVPVSPAGIPVSPVKVSVETKLASAGKATDAEAERLLQDLLARLDRNQATPTEQAMVSRQVQVVQLTCGELRAACKKRPGHDLALHFMKSLGNMPDSLQINIEQPDLEALLHNRRMVIRHQVIGDTVVMTKQVVDL